MRSNRSSDRCSTPDPLGRSAGSTPDPLGRSAGSTPDPLGRSAGSTPEDPFVLSIHPPFGSVWGNSPLVHTSYSF
ncbi:hypothetical protein E5769_04260 [Rhodococcus sp. PAMC28705]|nr:hypothetical protein E5769_04260 [Rhodococcus sp. PAMC28705]